MENATDKAARRQRKRPERRCKLARDGDRLTLTLTVGTTTTAYALAEFGADQGRGFELTKEDGSAAYHVNTNGMMSTCECKGFARWAHCKHVDALLALQVAGKL